MYLFILLIVNGRKYFCILTQNQQDVICSEKGVQAMFELFHNFDMGLS